MDSSSESEERARERAVAREALYRLRRMSSDDPEYEALREFVIGEYMSYARFVAHRFRLRGEIVQDLEQVAYLGLVKAVDNFDPDYGAAFLTYATPMIAGEVRRHFRDTTWDVHVPRRVQENSLAVRAAEQRAHAAAGRSPSAAEIAQRLDLSADDVAEAYEAGVAHNTVSLDVPVSMADGSRREHGRPARRRGPRLRPGRQPRGAQAAAGRTRPREKRILLMRFFRNMSQTEIGEELGVSQMQVSRLLSQIIGRLRDQMASEADPPS